MFLTSIYADEVAQSTGKQPEQSIDFVNIGLLLLFIVVLYFFSIRPQRKKQKQQADYINNLKKGDEVMTVGGLYGTVDSTTNEYVIICVDEHNHKLKFAKNAISYEATQQLNTPKEGKKV